MYLTIEYLRVREAKASLKRNKQSSSYMYT